MSCDNEATRGFWPLLPGHLKVDFGNEVALESIFKGLHTFLAFSGLKHNSLTSEAVTDMHLYLFCPLEPEFKISICRSC